MFNSPGICSYVVNEVVAKNLKDHAGKDNDIILDGQRPTAVAGIKIFDNDDQAIKH